MKNNYVTDFEKSKEETVKAINSKVMELSNDEKESILNILDFHACEPSAAAERISELLEVSYQSIYDLL